VTVRGAKKLDGKRVRILVDAQNMAGHKFKAGEEGAFTKCGVVACVFETDDGRRIMVGSWSPDDFEIVDEARRAP
jgi:hypothetical protein